MVKSHQNRRDRSQLIVQRPCLLHTASLESHLEARIAHSKGHGVHIYVVGESNSGEQFGESSSRDIQEVQEAVWRWFQVRFGSIDIVEDGYVNLNFGTAPAPDVGSQRPVATLTERLFGLENTDR